MARDIKTRPIWPSLVVAGVGFVLIAWLVLTRTSPYIDTAFQVGISRAPTFRSFLSGVIADDQAPGAQALFWLAARVGPTSANAQRLLSLVVSSLGYIGAVLVGTTAICRESPLADRRVLLVPTAAAILAGGVFTISTFARYSSLIGPVWLLVFLLSVRAVRGEPNLTFWIGLALGLAAVVAYSVAVPTACVALLLVADRSTRHPRLLARFGLGFLLGVIPVIAWFMYAGADHVHRVLTRVEEPTPTTLRSIVGRLYEMGAWVFVGPASLPTAVGILVLAAVIFGYVWLIRLAVTWFRIPPLALAAFVLLPVPLVMITHTSAGWSMVGPAAIASFVAGLGATIVRAPRATWGVAFLLGIVGVAVLTPLDVAVLRPTSYASQAEQAVAVAKTMHRPSVIVAGDWTLQMLADQEFVEPVVPAGDAARLINAPRMPTVLLLFEDPGRSDAASWQDATRARLEALGYTRDASNLVGVYDAYGLRQSLGIASEPSQYVVEEYTVH